MKPVPISQYLDHIGRVAQADPQSPRRDACAVQAARHPRGQDAEPRNPFVFSMALRDAATAARERALEDGPSARRSGRSDRRADEAAPLRPARDAAGGRTSRRASPRPMIAACARASAAARAEDADALARERAGQQEQALMERLDFQLNEYAQLADAIAAGLAEIEQRIAATVARILAPLLTSELSKQVVDELCDNIARLRAGGSSGLIKHPRPGASARGVARSRLLPSRRCRVRRRRRRRSDDRGAAHDDPVGVAAVGRPHRLARRLRRGDGRPASSRNHHHQAPLEPARRSTTAAPGRSRSPIS